MKKEKQKIPTCLEIESVVAEMWGYRKTLIVPNVSWGAGIHECDLLILRESGWATEVEIKVSVSDLKKDSTKGHSHDSKKILYLYFAIPEKLIPYIALIPERAGIILIRSYKYRDQFIPEAPWQTGFKGTIVKQPTDNESAVKWTEKERMTLGRLGCMRIWGLKKALIAAKNKK